MSRAKRNLLLVVLVVAAALSLGIYFKLHSPAETTVAARVNEEPITARELEKQILAERPAVYDYFKKKYNADDSPDFLTSVYGGEKPGDVLQKRALHAAVRIKIQQILMKEKGVMHDISYAAFLESW